MSSNDAVFGLFAHDKASEVFKNLGKVAKTTAHDTQTMTEMVDKASHNAIMASNRELAASAKVQIEQQKLTELRTKGTATTSAMMAQEERLAAALRTSEVATQASASAATALTSAEARAAFGADTMGRGFGKAGIGVGMMDSKFGKMVKTVTAASAAFAGYELFKFGKESVKAAEEFQLSQAKLQTAIANSGHSMTQYAKPVEELNTRFRKLGFTDSETADGLAVLTTSLKNPTKALSLMGTVADLARYKNLSLGDSALIVAKGYEGQLRPIRALGIDIPVAAGGALKLENANKALAKAQAHLLSLGGMVSVMNKKAVKEANAVSTAQLHLTNVTNKYSDPAKRNAAQTKAISAAQTVLTLEQQRGTVAHGGFQKAQEAVFAAQEKVNAAQTAGLKIVKAIADATKNQAANAAATLAGKQKVLNSELDHMKVTLGTDLMPLLNDFTDWSIKSGIPFMEHMMKFAKDHGKEIIGVMGAIATAFAAVKITNGVATLLGSIGKIKAAFVGLSATADVAAASEANALSANPLKNFGALKLLAPVAVSVLAAEAFKKSIGDPLRKATGSGGALTSSNLSGANHLKGSVSAHPSLATSADGSTWMMDSNGNLIKMSGAKKPVKPVSTGSSSPTHTTIIHVHGSVTTEKKLIETVHNGIAQNMKNSGKNPATIGK